MITTIHEYHQMQDKSSWGPGPWIEEPDKVQGVDTVTGYDTLIVRNGSGALCGYVGVPEGHPYFGLEYDSIPGDLHVHGGVTFTNSCYEPTRERWDAWKLRVALKSQEAIDYPDGEMAKLLTERLNELTNYEAWKEQIIASAVCHLPIEGRPDHVWWIGFDCAHSGDLSPAFEQFHSSAYKAYHHDNDIYRTRSYVESEIASLALQCQQVAQDATNA